MSFWKKWWKKKNKDKKGAEYEDSPLPTETLFADNDLEKRIRARRNNLSVSRSGRFKAKSKERTQLYDDLFAKDELGSTGQYENGSMEGSLPDQENIHHHQKHVSNQPRKAQTVV